jgi:hypothetical protein
MTIRFGTAYYLQEKNAVSLCNAVLLVADDGAVEGKESFRISSQWKDEDGKPRKVDHPLKLRQEALDRILERAGRTELYKNAKRSKESIEYFDFLNGSIDSIEF